MSRQTYTQQGPSDTRYGMGRQRTVTLACFGCLTRVRRAKSHVSVTAIVLCPACKKRVSDAYEARLRADGITPSLAPGNLWLPAWNRLSAAMARGDRELIGGLLAAPASGVAIAI